MYKKPGAPPEQRSTLLPKKGEFIGLVTKALGASKFSIMCNDHKERICSIPGRLKRRFWIKEGDLVIVKPWVVQADERGDVIWRYSMMDKDTLRQKGYEIPQ
ncbi:MAG: translation initiation factor eIF-1A [Candidatus Micrarchaeota archaeon]|nr:translation initiation factor eIF-1A [Candidatus Micrarchaeota archaeon]